jgi:hypothetical protein
MIDELEEPEPIGVKSMELHPCGCEETEFTSGTRSVKQCLACALHEAGNALQQASLRIREQRERDGL